MARQPWSSLHAALGRSSTFGTSSGALSFSVARRKVGFEQYLGGPPAPGGSFVTPLASAGLPSDILSQAPGVPQMNHGASFLQIDPKVEKKEWWYPYGKDDDPGQRTM